MLPFTRSQKAVVAAWSVGVALFAAGVGASLIDETDWRYRRELPVAAIVLGLVGVVAALLLREIYRGRNDP
jgi:hypothetical protein